VIYARAISLIAHTGSRNGEKPGAKYVLHACTDALHLQSSMANPLAGVRGGFKIAPSP